MDDKKGGTLLIRQAQIDLWEIFTRREAKEYDAGMLVLGSPGTGKSWAGMYFLVRAIKNGRTVVFESVSQGLVWVFSDYGSRKFIRPANAIICPELESNSTLHIFDAKAGGNEPLATDAKLIVLSSTNMSSYAQTIRRPVYEAFYPSVTNHEFWQYVEFFGTNELIAREIAENFGIGKIRPLRVTNIEDTLRHLDRAILRLDFNALELYSSVDTPSDGLRNPLNNPATLFDVYTNESKEESPLLLESRYRFSNGVWQWCSKYVLEKAININDGNTTEKIMNLFKIGNFQTVKKMMGITMGQFFEFFAPKSISKNGLVCQRFLENGNLASFSDGDNQLNIPSGLIVEERVFAKTVDIIKECTDHRVIYNFGNNIHGFDSFNPPNNFFKMTSTLTSLGKHPFIYSTFLTCCENVVGNLPVNIILVVPKGQEPSWKKIPSFKINNSDVVEEIKRYHKNDFKLNNFYSLVDLPPRPREAMKRLKFLRGVVDITKRNFSCSAKSNFLVVSQMVKYLQRSRTITIFLAFAIL